MQRGLTFGNVCVGVNIGTRLYCHFLWCRGSIYFSVHLLEKVPEPGDTHVRTQLYTYTKMAVYACHMISDFT